MVVRTCFYWITREAYKTLRDFESSLIAGNWPWWECLHHRNQQIEAFFFLSREPVSQHCSACGLVPYNNIILLLHIFLIEVFSPWELQPIFYFTFIFYIILDSVPCSENIWINSNLSILWTLKHMDYIIYPSSHSK